MITIVVGTDAALARTAVAKLCRHHDPEALNTSELDGQTVSLSQILAEAATTPFFGSCRIIIVRDLIARVAGSTGTAGQQSKRTKIHSGEPALGDILGRIPDQNLLMLVDAGLPSLPASIKKVIPSTATIIEATPPRGEQLIRWMVQTARDSESELQPAVARQLAGAIYPQTWSAAPTNPRFDRPPDLDLLRNEIERLALLAHPEPITERHLDSLGIRGAQDRIFRFLDAIANRQLHAAIVEYSRLQDAAEEPAKVLAQLHQQLELTVGLDIAGPRRDPTTIGRDLALANPARMASLARSRRSQGLAGARQALLAALAAERGIKRGTIRQPEDAVYDLIGSLAADPITPGHTPNSGT